MTFQELIDSLDLTKLEPANDHLDTFEEDLITGTHMGWSERFGERVQVIPVNTWVCTDTEVGFYAFFMDMKPIAVSYQSGRKNDAYLYWLDKEAASKMREFILSIDEDFPRIARMNLDEDVPALWIVSGGEW